MYYFLSQTGHLMGNDPVMIKIFASILRGPMFTWFMQTIKTWSDVQREFLDCLFEDDIEIYVHSLLAIKQKERRRNS